MRDFVETRRSIDFSISNRFDSVAVDFVEVSLEIFDLRKTREIFSELSLQIES